MKILFFTDTLSTGGKERRLTELIKHLKDKPDIKFELVVMSNDIHYKEVLDFGVKIHYIIRKTKSDILVFFRFYKLCREYRPDLIHCWDSMTAIYLFLTCKLLNIRLINGMVADSPRKQNIFNKYWFRARLTFPFSDIIVGNSKAGLQAYRAPKRKSVVIYNGFDFNRIKNLVNKQDIKNQLNTRKDLVIGMVASFSEYKDYPTYFTAAQLILKKRRDITFLAIGSRTDSIESRNLIDKQFIDNFRLLGKKSGVESFINIMDICVLSTFTEGISNSILEYMALSKPVIATEGGGTIEIVKDQQTGFIINPSDPQQLAEKMEILIDDPYLRERFGMEGSELIRRCFNIDLMVNMYIDLYNNSIAKR